jgi:hypothetical protein
MKPTNAACSAKHCRPAWCCYAGNLKLRVLLAARFGATRFAASQSSGCLVQLFALRARSRLQAIPRPSIMIESRRP